jgi:hypothetical protein
MRHLAISAIGATASTAIKLIGFGWERRAFAVVPITAIALLIAGVLYRDLAATGSAASATHPEISIISWGEVDTTHIDDFNGARGPGHIVYATVQITAGTSELAIPDISHADKVNRLWLRLENTSRGAPGAHLTVEPGGIIYDWLPSHEANLMPPSGGAPYDIPSAACSSIKPNQSCQITLAWELLGYGTVGTPLALKLESAATNDLLEIPWPDLAPETTCSGEMAVFCRS